MKGLCLVGYLVFFLAFSSQFGLPEAAHDHGHSHGHSHDHHGHSHEHSHSHGGHTHDHGRHTHSHSHGEEPHHDHEPPHHSHSHKYTKQANAQTSTNTNKVPPRPSKIRSTTCVWLEALGSTVLISAAPFFILFFIPLEKNTEEQQPLLRILLAFASGGLLGDAFLHLIPHAISPHTHGGEDVDHGHAHSDEGHGHSHGGDMAVGFWVLAGMIAFLIVEKFVRLMKGDHGHTHSHSHSHSHQEKPSNPDKKESKESIVSEKDSDSELRKRKKTDDGEKENVKTVVSKDKPQEEPEDIKVAGYLNLAADFTHNFTDGLAIGASFLVSRNLGIVTTLTILLHEVPHEIGDFAILVQSGCSKRKAMYLQLTTATGAIAGTLCGLLAHNIGTQATLWILPFTAGGFIYIATVSVIPELLQDSNLGQSIKEVLGLLFGVFMMVLIGQIE